LKKTLIPFALLALSHAVLAQQQPPSAGGQLLQIPPAPTLPRPAPQIRIEPLGVAPAAPAGADVRIVVNTLRITGERVYTEAELLALTGFTPGRELSLADLQSMAARITEHYRRNGYFVAQAFVPAQDIKDKAVTITVSEGRYGQVTLRNRSNLRDRVALASLEGLDAGAVIVAPPLESRLLQLSDLPGVAVKSTLVPGAEPGTSDLIVDVDPAQRVTGEIDADNAGSRYTGEYRIGATVNVNDPLGLGDLASLRVMTSGSGLRYARASYQLPVGRAQVGVAYSALEYSLRREFKPLHAHGTARIASAFARYPLVRSRSDNVYVQLAFDAKKFQDKVDSTPSVTDKKSNVLMAGVFGDHRDALGGGGLNSYGVTWSLGKLDIETPAALAADQATAHTNGHFNKLSFNAMRLQSLGGPFSVYAAINGQFASKNLDASEKMELGGMNAVRAYPEGEAYADEGAILTVEGRMDLPKFANVPGRMQLIVFADAGTVTLDRKPWSTGDNHRNLSGAGVGVNWSLPGNFMARAYYARKLGNDVATSAPDRSGRFWVQLVKFF
jgi:hemolysin activation/secretion protein